MPSSPSPRRRLRYAEGLVRSARASIRLARGDADGALEDLESALAQARDIKDPQRVLPSLVASARGRALLGHEEEARELAHEALQVARENAQLAASMHDLDVVAERLGIRDELREILELAPEGPWKDLALAGAAGRSDSSSPTRSSASERAASKPRTACSAARA